MPRLAVAATVSVVMMLFANLTFAIVDISSKWLLGAGYAAMQLAFFRYAIQFTITLVTAAGRRQHRLSTPRRLLPILFLRAVLLVAATILNFLALRTLSLAVTSAIMFSAPIIVCALSGPLLGERVGIVRWMAVILGFTGVLVVIRPFGDALDPAAFLMLLAATGLALYSLLTRKLSEVAAPLDMQFILGLTGTTVLAPFCWFFWVAPGTVLDFGLMISLGFFAWIGHEFLIRAHQIEEANFLMPFSYSYLIYMMAGGYFVFGNLPDIWTIMGTLMTALSGLIIWYRQVLVTQIPPIRQRD
ncbi:MAG: DMT family transporter [Rhodobacteraceae bacterium]|nr:DMT family transporter [Paracoccaceae bacterium]MCY4328173.1 DMT family transporter [Paracoccaceae bacterium]